MSTDSSETQQSGLTGLYSPTVIEEARRVQEQNRKIAIAKKQEEARIQEQKKAVTQDAVYHEERAYTQHPGTYQKTVPPPVRPINWRQRVEATMIEKMGPSNVDSVTGALRGVWEFTSDTYQGLTAGAVRTITGKEVKKEDLTPFPLNPVAEAGIGAVKSVESIVNPNVRTYIDLLGSEEDRSQYLKEIEKHPGELAGEIIGEVLIGKGIGKAGKAVGLSRKALVFGAGLNVGVQEAGSLVFEGKSLTPREMRQKAIEGAGLSIVGAGTLKAVGESGSIGAKLVSARPSKAVIEGGVDAVTSYVMSGGDPQEAVYGGLFGAGFSLGLDYLVNPLAKELSVKLGRTKRLTPDAPTIGKTGEAVPTYVSESVEDLGGRKVRVIPDVTERPADVRTLVQEYSGKRVPTGHATLSPESFELKKGGTTLLKGIPEEGAGFRQSKELFPFYSAPGTQEAVNIYGGYAGIGRGYSEVDPRIRFGGKATALVTLDTEISPEFSKRSGEGVDAFLDRVLGLSGKTGIAPENILGRSTERQVITPTAYSRKGVDLPGSLFVSEGKLGTFQIKEEPSGVLGKIPVLRSMLATYTDLDVFTGSFKPVAGLDPVTGKSLDVQKYGSGYGKTVPVSTPILVGPVVSPGVSVPVKSPEVLSLPRSSTKSLPVEDPTKSLSGSRTKSRPTKSPPSFPSFPSLPVEYSLPSSPGKASGPSIPSLPSFPSVPSIPSYPSFPSYPKGPSVASIPSLPSTPSSLRVVPFARRKRTETSRKKRGKKGYRTIVHPVPTLEELKKVGSKKSGGLAFEKYLI